MREIKTIDNIVLKRGISWAVAKIGDHKQEVHLTQGSLDGACGAYSLAIVLIILGVIDKESIKDIPPDKRKPIGKLIAELTQNNGLFPMGLTLHGLKKMIDNNCPNILENQICKGDDKIQSVIETNIEANLPTIIRIDYDEKDAHWLVAVGLSYNQKGMIEQILCIDPGAIPSSISVWNEVIEINTKGKYFHKNYVITLTEAMTIKAIK